MLDIKPNINSIIFKNVCVGENIELKLDNMNIITGINGSGKSVILKIISLISNLDGINNELKHYIDETKIFCEMIINFSLTDYDLGIYKLRLVNRYNFNNSSE